MIIAIHGEKQSGKDTIGAIFQYICCPQIHNYFHNNFKEFLELNIDERNFFCFWQIKKFAGKVNDCFKLIRNIDFLSLEGVEKEKYRNEFRDLAEGTKNTFGREIWAQALFLDYIPIINNVKSLHQDLNWIITDLRFKEEISLVKKYKGITISINPINKNDNHISEINLDGYKFDYYLDNSKRDLDELYNQIFIIKKQIETKLGYKLDYII
jgi:hypothetical protein